MAEEKRIVIRCPFERHAHFREGEMIDLVLPWTLKQNFGAIVIGNLTPPNETSTIAKTLKYKEQLLQRLPANSNFKFCMTCYLTDDLTPEELIEGFETGVWCAIKMFLTTDDGGGSHNSSRAVRDLFGRYKIFEPMNRRGIPLLTHCESPEMEIDEFDREFHCFRTRIVPILKKFPEMPVVIEHVSDRRVAKAVHSEKYPNLYATVTAHHPMMNRNAMFRGGMNPINFCRPVLKREIHRLWIRKYMTSGSTRFGAGLDSAAHSMHAKCKASGCNPGIVTAPVGAELYATIFEEENAMEHYGNFMSVNLLHLYGVKPSTKNMTLVRREQEIPKQLGDVLICKGGTKIPWTMETS